MYASKKVILKPLEEDQAGFLFDLYANPQVAACFDENPFLPGETAQAFTQRIISACQYIFTIRPARQPELMIGDCALHHWDPHTKEIEIGGSLYPEYWGKGYMQAAFEILTTMVRQELGVVTLIGNTKAGNTNAIRLLEKMGFEKHPSGLRDIILRKRI